MRFSRLTVSVFATLWLALLSGCVTTAEQTASEKDIKTFERRVTLPAVFDEYDEEDLEPLVREMVDTPIEFHGRVTDEDGQPMADFEVRLLVFDRVVDPFEYPFVSFTQLPAVKSRRDGTFSVTGVRGAGLHVAVTKPGYKPVSPSRRIYLYAEPIQDAGEVLPSKTEPAVFVFEPRPPEAEVRRVATGALRLPVDGQSLNVSLRDVSPYGVAEDRSDLQVACARGKAADAKPFDWTCRVEVPGGGVKPVRRLAFDRAPKRGYTEAIEFGHTADDPAWDHRDRRELFVRLSDQTYAYVLLRMRLQADVFVSFDGVWNPTGSTLLD